MVQMYNLLMKNPKYKLLKILEILIKKADSNHPISTNQIIAILANEYGIVAERKGIYRDLHTLKQNQLAIVYDQHQKGYYLDNYGLKLADVKLLTDMICSSTFISQAQSEALIANIFQFVSDKNCQIIQKQMVYPQNKSTNPDNLITIEKILKAIDENCLITFKYFDLNEKHERVYRHKIYRYQPIALFYDDNKYYLIAYHLGYQSLTHFRVDKIAEVNIQESQPKPYVDLQNYLETSFSMFSGQKENITLEVATDKLNLVYDKIASEILIINKTQTHYQINFYLQINKIFIAWLFANQDFIKVLKPNSLKSAMINYAKAIIETYKEEV